MLQTGFARVDVTPPLGTLLTGYFALRVSDGILDPIELNALAISNDEDTALLITGDFMYTLESTMTRFRKLVSLETGIPMDHIFAQSIHQHTTTTPGATLNGDPATDALYLQYLERKFCDVAKIALDDRSEASVSIGQKETAEPISFIRRYRMKDGSTRTNPGHNNPNVVGPIGNADNTVRLVKFERKDADDIALVNFQTHPDVIGGNKFSADWPGFARRLTEKDLPGVKCILVNGAQGDTNHIDVNSTIKKGGYKHSQHMGQIIADAVVQMWDKTTHVEPEKVSAKVVFIHTPTNTNGIERFNECFEIAEAFTNGEDSEKAKKYDGEVRRISRMAVAPVIQKVPVSILAFGQIALIGFGGEPFTEYADIARQAVPDLFILSACNANGAQGYLPSVSSYEEGGYESRTSNFTPESVPLLQNTAIELLKEHVKAINTK